MKKRKKARRIMPPPRTRTDLEQEFGKVWDTQELATEFVITSIIGLEVVVRRKADNVVGMLSYQNEPRLYYRFVEAPATEPKE
jgi:hypothetical protein